MYNIICNYIIQQKITMYCKYTDTTDTGGKEMGNEIANQGEILLYNDEGEKQYVSVIFAEETFWLSQNGMAELFDCTPENIIQHLKNIYAEEELSLNATAKKFLVVRREGNRNVQRSIDHYNLDAIIAVGYRVNSKKATRFRQWATKTLKEYIQKGFVLNDEMMKNGRPFGRDYFDELLERIREIRASERRAYQKIADVFEQCSYDYDKNSETTKAFYAFVQNKLHYAAHGHTAAEVIFERADAEKPFMGLTAFSGDFPTAKDIAVAKNYLSADELKILNNLVSGYFDFAEIQAMRSAPRAVSDAKRVAASFSSVASRTQMVNSRAAGSISSALAKLGAIRMLLSCGSRP